MKIVHFMASAGWGGAEKVFVELANELAKAHEVIAVVLRETEYIARFSPEVRLVELQSHPTRHNPFLLFELYTVLRSIKPDIIHTHAAKGTELVFTLNRFLRSRHVGTKHNVRKGRIFNRMEFVTAVSPESGRSIKGKAGAKVVVINNPIRPISQATTRKYEKFTLVAIGRLDKIKGFDILISQVRDLELDFQLFIIGDGPEQKQLERLIDDYAVGGRVRLLGYQEKIPEYMSRAHVVVISSHSEGSSIVLLEALYYADVLISTPVGIAVDVLPEIFLTEQQKIGEKIAAVYADYQDYSQQFLYCRQKVSGKFHIARIAGQYMDFYATL